MHESNYQQKSLAHYHWSLKKHFIQLKSVWTATEARLWYQACLDMGQTHLASSTPQAQLFICVQHPDAALYNPVKYLFYQSLTENSKLGIDSLTKLRFCFKREVHEPRQYFPWVSATQCWKNNNVTSSTFRGGCVIREVEVERRFWVWMRLENRTRKRGNERRRQEMSRER